MNKRTGLGRTSATGAAMGVLMILVLASSAPAAQASKECAGTWWVSQGQLEAGKPLPEFGFATCRGAELTTSEFAGQPLLVNFWATWCPPCVKELPNLVQLHDDNEGEIAVVGVSVDRSPDAVRSFLEHNDLPYLLAWDSSGIAAEFGFDAIPATIAVNADGNVVDIHHGYASQDDLAALLAAAGGTRLATTDADTDAGSGIKIGDSEGWD